jgi:hypothetical protein
MYPPDVDVPHKAEATLTPLEWYRDVYPTLAPQERPLVCLQQAGDIMYIPEGFKHAVVNIGATVAVGGQTRLPAKNPELLSISQVPSAHTLCGICALTLYSCGI